MPVESAVRGDGPLAERRLGRGWRGQDGRLVRDPGVRSRDAVLWVKSRRYGRRGERGGEG